MSLAAFRKELKWSQGDLARRLGLRSKSSISMIESGQRTASLAVALKIEKISDGKVPAASLCPEAADILRSPAAPSMPAAT